MYAGFFCLDEQEEREFEVKGGDLIAGLFSRRTREWSSSPPGRVFSQHVERQVLVKRLAEHGRSASQHTAYHRPRYSAVIIIKVSYVVAARGVVLSCDAVGVHPERKMFVGCVFCGNDKHGSGLG